LQENRQSVNIKIAFLRYPDHIFQVPAGRSAMADKCRPPDQRNVARKDGSHENLLVIIVLTFCFIIFIFQLYLWFGGIINI
jgi:hypothetical protein